MIISSMWESIKQGKTIGKARKMGIQFIIGWAREGLIESFVL